MVYGRSFVIFYLAEVDFLQYASIYLSVYILWQKCLVLHDLVHKLSHQAGQVELVNVHGEVLVFG